jgi:hypothetical protein
VSICKTHAQPSKLVNHPLLTVHNLKMRKDPFRLIIPINSNMKPSFWDQRPTFIYQVNVM